MFWYIARNERGKTGMVPRNFLEPLEEGIDLPVALMCITVGGCCIDDLK